MTNKKINDLSDKEDFSVEEQTKNTESNLHDKHYQKHKNQKNNPNSDFSEKDLIDYLTKQCEELFGKLQQAKSDIDNLTTLNERQNAMINKLKENKENLQKEFDNYRHRVREAEQKSKLEGTLVALEKMLPIVDAVEQAINSMTDPKVIEGLKMLYKQIIDLFTKFGVEEIEALGLEFDPNYHNAVMNTEAEDEEELGKIVEVLRKGYKIGEKIIRHSAVKVANKLKNNN